MSRHPFAVRLLLFSTLSWALSSCSLFKNSSSSELSSSPSRPPSTYGVKSDKPSSTNSKATMRYRYSIVDEAERYLNTPYKYAGRTPQSGFDCSGFTQYVLLQRDIAISPASYLQSQEGEEIPLDQVKPGDLIFFGENNKVSHVAMVYERSTKGIICIHSTTSKGVIKDNISTSSYWKPKILFARDVISSKLN
ncbi:MAG: C40 family peptidase [Chitinophagales bacterium]